MNRLPFLLSLGLACSSGGEDKAFESVPPPPALLLEGSRLVFPALAPGETASLPVALQNIGSGTLVLEGIEIRGGAFDVPTPPPSQLEPLERASFQVQFTAGEVASLGSLTLISNDPVLPQAVVDLEGPVQQPQLTIEPNAHAFLTPIPCIDQLTLRLRNTGAQPLRVDSLEFEANGPFGLLQVPVFPTEVLPGADLPLTLTYGPPTLDSGDAVLTVNSNHPGGPVRATFTGRGEYAETALDTYLAPDPAAPAVLLFFDPTSPTAEAWISAWSALSAAFSDGTPFWKLAVFTTEDGCAAGGALDPTAPETPDQLAEALRTATDHPLGADLFQLASLALAQTGPGGCNEGLIGPDGTIHLIFDSPRDPASPGEAVLAEAQALSPVPARVTVSALRPVKAKGCAEGGGAYADLADLALDTCDPKLAERLPGLAEVAHEPLRWVPLSGSPQEASLEVTVNTVTSTRWTFQEEIPRIRMDDVLATGERVGVAYGLTQLCP